MKHCSHNIPEYHSYKQVLMRLHLMNNPGNAFPKYILTFSQLCDAFYFRGSQASIISSLSYNIHGYHEERR